MIQKKFSEAVNVEILDQLNQVYISARYPSDMGLLPYGKPTIQDANMLSSFAKDIYDRITSFLAP
ncbi:MAG: hypothetical protein GKR87_04755 [Kiritimatiellae bacterium]|nr:hypothetical protein [Kiritimatiellia bacterium]